MYQHQHAPLPLEQLKDVPQPVALREASTFNISTQSSRIIPSTTQPFAGPVSVIMTEIAQLNCSRLLSASPSCGSRVTRLKVVLAITRNSKAKETIAILVFFFATPRRHWIRVLPEARACKIVRRLEQPSSCFGFLVALQRRIFRTPSKDLV